MLGLCFCASAFSSCGEWGPLFIAVRGPLTVAASLVAEHRLQTRRLSSCGSRAQLLRDMWDLPNPGLEPMSPALAGRFSTTAPPGKPKSLDLMVVLFSVFFRNLHTVFIAPAPIYIPTNSVWRFPFSISLPTFVIFVLFDESHSDRCEVIFHCGFDLHFSDD